MEKIARNHKDFDKFDNGKNKFAKGNVIGRMPKKGYTLNDLTKLAMEYDETNDVSILSHYIDQLKKDNRLLENFVNRYIPPKQEIDVKVPDTIKVKAFIQAGKEPVIEEEEPEIEKEIQGEEIKEEIREEAPKEIETVLNVIH